MTYPGFGPSLLMSRHNALDDLVQALDDRFLHGLQAHAGIAHGIGDAGHHVLAVGHLGVHHGLGVHHLAGVQVRQVAHAGRRADVHGKPVALLDEPRLRLDDLLVHPDGDRGLPSAFANHVLEVLQDQIIEGEALEPVVVLKELQDPFPVPGRHVVERGRGELDVVFFHGRIELDRELFGRLPDDLLARAGTLGHEDLDVAPDLALAGQSDAGPVLGLDVLHLVGRRHGRGEWAMPESMLSFSK